MDMKYIAYRKQKYKIRLQLFYDINQVQKKLCRKLMFYSINKVNTVFFKIVFQYLRETLIQVKVLLTLP